jgi:hypothetical protein
MMNNEKPVVDISEQVTDMDMPSAGSLGQVTYHDRP